MEHNVERHQDFLYTIQHEFSGTGREFVTIDESSKNEHNVAHHYGHAPIGMPMDFEDFFVRGIHYTLVAAMGIDGYIMQHVVEGSLDSFGFFDFIVEEVMSIVGHNQSLIGANHLQVLEMGVFPDDHSVLVMDNCRIHHTDTLQETLNDQGSFRDLDICPQLHLIFLSRHHALVSSPLLAGPQPNRVLQHVYVVVILASESYSRLFPGKAYLRANIQSIRATEDLILILLESTGCITPEKARTWFRHAGYIVQDGEQ